MNLYLEWRGLSLKNGLPLPKSFARWMLARYIRLPFLTDLSHILILMQGGLACADAIAMMAEHASLKVLREIWEKIYVHLWSGYSIAQAFESVQPLTDPPLLALLESGVHAGTLQPMLKDYQIYQQWYYDTRQKTVQALAYPVVVLMMVVLCGIGIMAYLIPHLISLSDGFAMDLPLLTRGIITVWLRWDGRYVGVCILLMAMAWWGGKRCLQIYMPHVEGWGRYHLPLMGSVYEVLDVAQWLRVMGVLYRAQIPLAKALAMATQACACPYLKYRLNQISDDVINGHVFSQALHYNSLIPPAVVALIRVAETSGEWGAVWHHINLFFQAQLDRYHLRITTLLQPIALITVALVLLGIIYTLVMPMYESLGVMSG